MKLGSSAVSRDLLLFLVAPGMCAQEHETCYSLEKQTPSLGHKWLLFAKSKMFVNQCGIILFLNQQIHLNVKFRHLGVIFRFKMQTWMYMINNICKGKECSNVTTEISQLYLTTQ